MKIRLQAASRAALLHFACGLLVSGLLVVVFVIWFPYPYYEVSSAKNLFLILFVVDLVCGPILTLLLFDPAKDRWKWMIDVVIIISLQLAALVYGISNIAQSRPVFLAYEGDRFRIVYAADIDVNRLAEASSKFQHLSWTGPVLVGVRLLDSTDPGYLESLRLALEGEPPGFRADRWVDYSTQKSQLNSALKPLEGLVLKFNSVYSFAELEIETGLKLAELGYLPLVQESMTDWIVIVGRADGLPKAYWHVDGW